MVALCSHPRLLQGTNISSLSIEQLIKESSKLQYLKVLLDRILDKSEKAVIFTRFKVMQNIIAKAINHWYSFIPSIINGELPTDKRAYILDRFRKINGFNVIILSPEAAGVGITITEANHVIHYTRLWNPAKEAQATDRVYRIGQDKEVFVYYPILTFHEPFHRYFASEREYIDAFIDSSTVDKTPEEKLNRILVKKKMVLNNFFLAAGDFEVDMVKEWEDEQTNPQMVTVDSLKSLNAHEFEALCSLLYRKMGYKSYLTRKSGDYGVDVVAERDGQFSLVQSKHMRQNNLPREALNDVIGARSIYEDVLGASIDKLVVISTCEGITDSVKQVAEYNHLQLILNSDLNRLLSQYPVYFSEICIEDRERYSIEQLRCEVRND